ncbi:unnamed protein product [Clonostachys chloroleuca]|uniref:Uncharacterized protein n=1 Tax=Clonostachys chloroleuca TaxID=1926264 RepID=A0AA35LQD1_9HYPO|nr:unnamed protein product [Clonostachys chloroleuca]
MAITTIESSDHRGASLFDRKLSFPNTDHTFVIFDGAVDVAVEDKESATAHSGDVVFIARDTSFSLTFKSRYVGFCSYADGDGIEALIQLGGEQYSKQALPDEALLVDQAKLAQGAKSLGVDII